MTSKVTSKRQVTVPKAVAERYGIRPGTVLEWVPAGDVIRVIPGGRRQPRFDVETRLELFDASVQRQTERETISRVPDGRTEDRGWTREDAHMWAYAEVFGMDELISEDFQAGRLYGTGRIVNPFE